MLVATFGAPYVLLLSLAMKTVPAAAAGALNPGAMALVAVLLAHLDRRARPGPAILAGIGPISRFDALRVADWDAMIDVNLRGTLHGIAAALPVFLRQDHGHVVNVVSTAGLKILPTMGVYAATKNAVRTATEALRQEAGATLRVTEVSPGMVATGFADSIPDASVREAMASRMAGIAMAPEAVARGILFALEQPAEVEVGSIVLRPTAQG
ncbi:SDR family NAD(P)-dependent oxidoreductase [Pseudooceanicola sp. GBMRC 2024]|uniref:SDR family NAD(P)-dependent oxidoreductase n=2 Tax=Pseudooceanicola albus TaxID=2692189 RepID=A0A6L7G148_9RHOB|nr:SDR family NAD(P)-dependent oxidoreductase [Pseudooceanicola albus]